MGIQMVETKQNISPDFAQTISIEEHIPSCPNGCQTGKILRAGLRYNKDGTTSQRWQCKYCKVKFSEKLPNTDSTFIAKPKIFHVPKAKHYGTAELNDETKAMITIFEGWLTKEGYAESCYPSDLKTLVYLGANLMDPEDVKAKIGAHNVKNGTKMLLCYSYEAFLKMNKMTWDRPTYRQEEIIPFIPEETELDQLIAASHSKRMAAYLQTLKETFADPEKL